MASNDYLKLCEEAQKKKLKLIKKQEKQIKEIYNDMYLNVSKKLSKVNPNTLSERYLQELKKVLEKEIKSSNKQVKEVIKDNIEKSSKLANDTQLDFFMSINDKYSLNMGDTFSSMFSKIPKEAMNEILFGKVYKDRAGLSERIWLDTKKFNKDIDYVIAEGIANKKPTYEIAKDLEKYVNPNAKKEWEWSKVYPNANKVVDYNAQRLARTSVNHAFQQAQKRSCKKNPYVEGIRWISSNIHGRTCELCRERDNQVFSVKDVPLDHPNGLCTTVPEIPMSLDEIGAELRNWVDGEVNAKLDKWFKKYGEEFAGIEKTPKNNSEKTTTFTSTKNKKVKEIDYLQSLANKGVKVDLDSFKNIDKKLFNENAKQLDYLINKYPKVQEYIKNNPFIFKAESMNISTNACCGTNFEKTQMSIALNIKNYNDYNDLIDSAKKCIESRWSCKGLEEKLSVKTLTHEFGHAIHNVLIDNYNKTHQEEKNEYVKKAMSANTISASRKKLRQYDEKLVKSFNKEIIKIAKGIDKNLDTKESISKYGKTSPYEFFAECFAEYECHGGTTYAKAMEIFLERNFK